LKIITLHSLRGGTGKSTLTANLAALLARWGCRVGVVDLDLPMPGLHVLLGLDPIRTVYTLNDYLDLRCEIDAAAYDVTAAAIPAPSDDDTLILLPGRVQMADMARMADEGYDAQRLQQGLMMLGDRLQLDLLLLDTQSGLRREALHWIAQSTFVLWSLCPDSQDFQGMAAILEVIQRLGRIPQSVVVNRTPPSLEPQPLKVLVEETFHLPVAGVVSHWDEVMLCASRGLVALQHADSPFCQELEAIACQIQR
jgi:MinD-like ATPase involved in chromosome partitioning or flagellar assembly